MAIARLPFTKHLALLALGLAAAGCGGADLSISPTVLPNAVQGTAYSAQLISSGEAPFTWTITQGQLAGGMTLDPSKGIISGTPTGAGVFAFSIESEDDSSGQGHRDYQLTVIAPLAVDATLPNGRARQAYSHSFAPTGGVPPYAFSISGLPGHFSLDAVSGALTGSPDTLQEKQWPLQLTVTDSGAPQQKIQVITAMLIGPPIVTISTTSLPDGTVGQAYSQSLASADGSSQVQWKISDGLLPAGLHLDKDTGLISGTPTAAGALTFTVEVDDLGSPPDFATAQLTLTINPTQVSVTTTALPEAKVGTAYSQTLTSANGSSNLSWSVSAGTLPDGLHLDATGVLSGTPTAAGESTFTVQVDDLGSPPDFATAQLTLTVQP